MFLNDGNYQEPVLCRQPPLGDVLSSVETLESKLWIVMACLVTTFSAASFIGGEFDIAEVGNCNTVSQPMECAGTGVPRDFHVPDELNGELSQGFLN